MPDYGDERQAQPRKSDCPGTRAPPYPHLPAESLLKGFSVPGGQKRELTAGLGVAPEAGSCWGIWAHPTPSHPDKGQIEKQMETSWGETPRAEGARN